MGFHNDRWGQGRWRIYHISGGDIAGSYFCCRFCALLSIFPRPGGCPALTCLTKLYVSAADCTTSRSNLANTQLHTRGVQKLHTQASYRFLEEPGGLVVLFFCVKMPKTSQTPCCCCCGGAPSLPSYSDRTARVFVRPVMRIQRLYVDTGQ